MARTQYGACSKWLHRACGGLKEDNYELYCQYDTLSWFAQFAKSSWEGPSRGKTQLGQRQTMPKKDDKGALSGATVINGLLEAAVAIKPSENLRVNGGKETYYLRGARGKGASQEENKRRK